MSTFPYCIIKHFNGVAYWRWHSNWHGKQQQQRRRRQQRDGTKRTLYAYVVYLPFCVSINDTRINVLTALPLLRNTQNISNSDWLAHGWLADWFVRSLTHSLARSLPAYLLHRASTAHSFQCSLTVKYYTHFVWHCAAAGWLAG